MERLFKKIFDCTEDFDEVDPRDPKFNTFHMHRATLKSIVMDIKIAFIKSCLDKINEECVLFNQEERQAIYSSVRDILGIVSPDLRHVPDMWVGRGKWIGFEFTSNKCKFYVGELSKGYPDSVMYLVERRITSN